MLLLKTYWNCVMWSFMRLRNPDQNLWRNKYCAVFLFTRYIQFHYYPTINKALHDTWKSDNLFSAQVDLVRDRVSAEKTVSDFMAAGLPKLTLKKQVEIITKGECHSYLMITKWINLECSWRLYNVAWCLCQWHIQQRVWNSQLHKSTIVPGLYCP